MLFFKYQGPLGTLTLKWRIEVVQITRILPWEAYTNVILPQGHSY